MHTQVKIFKALADKTRIEILAKLLKEGEMSCQELSKAFRLSQPTLSYHYNKLVDANILLNRRKGVLWFYKINRQYLKEIGLDLQKVTQKTHMKGR